MPTYSLSPLFNGWQGFDASGNPMAAGTISVYLAGLSTPTPTYTSSTGAVQNSNPINLNGGGYPPNEIWLDDTIPVKFVVSNASGSETRTYDNVSALSSSSGTLRVDLADTASTAKGDALIGFKRTFTAAVASTLHTWHEWQVIDVKEAGAVGDGATNDTAAIIAANAAAKLAGKRLYFPAGTYEYTPTTFLETYDWVGDGKNLSIIRVNAAAYGIGSVVFRLTRGSYEGLTIREKTLDKTRAILVQLSDTAATNAVGGALTFTAYLDLTDVWVLGGLIALDIGNVFTCSMTRSRFNMAGTGVNITPANDAGDNGYANTLSFVGCEIADNSKNVNANTAGGKLNGLSFINGSIERALVSSSTFTNVQGLSFQDTYVEQAVALSPITITSCTGVYAKFNLVGSNCDLTLGTNTEIQIDGWSSGDGTQTVSLKNCTFPAAGNSAFFNFLFFNAENSTYNGTYYGNYLQFPTIRTPLAYTGGIATYASAATIAPIVPFAFVTGVVTIQTITAPAAVLAGSGQITLIPTGLWSTNTAGNIALATTAVVNKALILTFDSNTAKWYPSYT